MEKLFKPENLSKEIKNPLFQSPFMAHFIFDLIGLDRINEIYNACENFQGAEFAAKILEQLNIRIELPEADLKQLPKNEPVIFLSNHPFGLLDGLAMIQILGKRNEPFKVMANYLIKRIPQLDDLIIPVDNFSSGNMSVNRRGLKDSLKSLKNGESIGLFPSGEVAHQKGTWNQTVSDSEWKTPILKLIRKAEVSVVPIYFHGKNSRTFYNLGRINPGLRTASLPREFLLKANLRIPVRMGQKIRPEKIAEYDDLQKLGAYIRNKVYSMSPESRRKRISAALPRKESRIQDPVDPLLLEMEMNGLENRLFLEKGGIKLYLVRGSEIPMLLSEIGRLRELTFREIGEGTGKKSDLDKFDKYYHHLFAWSPEEKKILAAYRLGNGADIIPKYGPRGLYTSKLFKYKEPFYPYLKESLELGRSFVIKEYQKRPFPLFILWKGILLYLLNNPDLRYILGPVSISNSYSKLSRSLIVEYLKRYHFNQHLSQFIKARKKFKASGISISPGLLLEDMDGSDINQFEGVLSDIEPRNKQIPVLLKKYIKENAEILGFNIDPNFNHSLDGLMFLDLQNLNETTVHLLSREMGTVNKVAFAQ